MMEEWHQKLHNNSSADDVIICEIISLLCLPLDTDGYGGTRWRGNRRQLAERKELPREVTGLIGRGAVRKTDKKHRKRPSEINLDRKEGERWPEGRSESQLETAEGKELRERQKDPNKDIRPDGRFKPPLVDASPSCSDATGSDPYTNGSRLGYREMVPKSDGLIVRILPDGRRVLTRLFRRDSDRVSAFCTGYGIEPSVDGSVMTGPRLVLDGGMVLLTGYGAVEPSKSGYRNWTKELSRLTKLDRLVIWRLLGAVTEQLLERYWIGKPSKAVGREKLQAGLSAERLGWWRNRPSVSFKWDFADQRAGHRERTEGKELRERQTDPNRDIRPDGRFKPPLVDASASCSDATSSDPYTNGSRLGYQEMASVLMMRIRRQELFEAVNRCIVLERDTGGMDSDRVSAFCTGYGIEPSVDGSVMTGPRLVLDGGMVLLTGYEAVELSMY
ncbi:hypothetical protein YC2023_041655 [Brassica napus]